MNPTYAYDLIVIGAGIAGMVSAVTANGLGKREVKKALTKLAQLQKLMMFNANHL